MFILPFTFNTNIYESVFKDKIKSECKRKLKNINVEELDKNKVCNRIFTSKDIENTEYKSFLDKSTNLTFVIDLKTFNHPDIGLEWYCKKDISECFYYNDHSISNRNKLLKYAIGILN
jgi:hypothetical protein